MTTDPNLSRKYIKDSLNSLEHIKSRYLYFENNVVRLLGADEYHRTVLHFDKLIDKMREELDSSPIGFRYTGTFYIKAPYKIPAQFEKIEGSAFMREDLVSWQLYQIDGTIIPGYIRTIYSAPSFESEIKKSNALPVYKSQQSA